MNDTSIKYTNPPILEAVCEVVFDKDLAEVLSSNENLQKLKELLIDEVPKYSSMETFGRVFDIQKQSATPAPECIFQFAREDEKTLLRVYKNKISIHRFKPYQKWQLHILPLIQKVFIAINEVFTPQKVLRTGLRYINEIQISDPQFKMEDYFPGTGTILSNETGIEVGFQITSQRELTSITKSSIRATLAQNPSPTLSETGERKVMLDIDVFSLSERDWSQEETIAWLNAARLIARASFESSLSTKAKSLFL